MELAAVHSLVDGIGGIDVALADRAMLTAGIGDVRRLMGWCLSVELDLVGALGRVSSFPEKDVADATRSDLTDGVKAMERVDTTAAMPELGAALADGEVGIEHLDAAGRVRRGLDESLRPAFDAKSEQFAEQAAATTPREFARLLNREARRLEQAAGVDRLGRQRRANSVKAWVDPVTGMWNIRGTFDPVTGARLAQRLDEALATTDGTTHATRVSD